MRPKPFVMLMVNSARFLIDRLWAIFLLVALWQVYITISGVNRIVMPSPLDVGQSIINKRSLYFAELIKTASVGVLGLFFGTLVGTLAAITAWLSKIAQGTLLTGITIIRVIPLVVIVPILARLLGYNSSMVVVVITVISFFPSFILVASGLSSLPAAADDLGSVFGASKFRRLIYIALPIATPKFFASVRLCSSHAILGAMVTEFVTGVDGLGKLFLVAQGSLDSEMAISAALIGGVTAIILLRLAEWLELRANSRIF